MKRSTLYKGLGSICFGVICMTVAINLQFKLKSLLGGLGGAGIGIGIRMVLEYMHWSKPENQNEYDEKLRNEKINRTDERRVMLIDKSGRIMHNVMMGVHLVLMIIFYFAANNGLILPFSLIIFIGLTMLLAFQFIGVAIVFNYLNKRL